ncbi:uncharacterized protein LOC135845307 isoform X2 [Planococcus citri]|uniref:uncharacterized protein LOC135845307 isoform X2 n=1 Tax=Planococcus citri TaxID=170843 RepID=UPI0031F873A6
MIISGYMAELWNIIEETLHFKNQFIEMNFRDGKEALIRGSVDIILIPVVVTSSDADFFHFSIPVAKNWYEMYMKRNKGEATSVSYLETWNPSLWIAFTLSIFILSLILWMMIKTRKILGLDDVKEQPTDYLPKWKKVMEENSYSQILAEEHTSLSSCFLMVLGGITSQGFNMNPKSASLRIVMLVVLFFGLIMINSYAAVLVSRLAVDKVDILFPTLESVIERKTHTLCVRDTGYAYRLFKENESDPQIMPIWQTVVNQPPCSNTSTVQDIAVALCQDSTVVLESPHIIASIMESRTCSITRMPGRYATAYTSLLMRKNFTFRRDIDEILQKLSTSGVIDYLQKKWLHRRMPPEKLNMSSNKPVTIEHINGLLIVYAISIILALVVLLVEKFIDWKKSKNTITLKFAN